MEPAEEETKKIVDQDDVQLEVKKEPGSEIDWDYVFMMGNTKRPTGKEGAELPDSDPKVKKFFETQKARVELIKLISDPSVGLSICLKKSSDHQSFFVLITATQQRFEDQAELMELNMKLKDQFGGGWAPFEANKKDMFNPEDENEGFFRKLQKIYLIESILQGDPDRGGAGLNLDRLCKNGVISKVFPMHSEDKRKELIYLWANPKMIIKPQPLKRIRDYFGEEITIYFAWLGFYTRWLWFASILGLIAAIFWWVHSFGDVKWAAWWSTFYAVFLSLWSTFFLEYWKRYNNKLNYEWGMLDYKEREVERTDFEGETMVGVWHNGVWVTLDPDSSKYGFNLVPPKKKYYPTKIRRVKIVFGLPIAATMMAVVVVATFAILTIRFVVQKKNETGGSIVGAAINAISIIIMNTVWKFVATKLNDWENHRTESDYENNLIVKIFLFYFVNSYTSLYYIAFFKRGFRFFERGDLVDRCAADEDSEENSADTISNGCADELTLQLVTILAVNMFIGQAREVAIPWLLGKLQLYFLVRKTGEERENISIWERDSKKQMFPGTFDEYSEMVIQYGYITLFASTFPLAPLMAALNNMVEIRTDAFKLLTSHPRPAYRGAQNIGTWYQILEVLGVIAVMTNCALIGLSFEVIKDTVEDNRQVYFTTLGIVVFMEHVILFLKYVISVLVPDFPGWIIKQLAYEDFIKNEGIKLANRKINGFEKPHWDNTKLSGVEDEIDLDAFGPSQ